MNSFKKSAVEARFIRAANISKLNSLIQKRARQARASKREENDHPYLIVPAIAGRSAYIYISVECRRRRERALRQYL